jgi:hypothetical protein
LPTEPARALVTLVAAGLIVIDPPSGSEISRQMIDAGGFGVQVKVDYSRCSEVPIFHYVWDFHARTLIWLLCAWSHAHVKLAALPLRIVVLNLQPWAHTVISLYDNDAAIGTVSASVLREKQEEVQVLNELNGRNSDTGVSVHFACVYSLSS